MSGAVFILDDDPSTPSPTVSPKPSPPSSRQGSPVQALSFEPADSSSPTMQIPSSGATPISASQPPPPPTSALHPHPKRPHGASFAATAPSFPSPLTRPSIVPRSDSSSSSRSSSSDNEVVGTSTASGTPKRRAENFFPSLSGRGSPSTRSNSPTGQSRSRPASPVKLPGPADWASPNAVASGSSSRQQVVTPGGLLLRGKRSSSGSTLLNPFLAPETPSRAMAVSGAGSGMMRLAQGSPSASEPRSGSASTSGASASGSQSGHEGAQTSRNRSSSNSSHTLAGRSPLAFGSPDLGPMDGESLPPMPVGLGSAVATGKGKAKAEGDTNLLGLGYGAADLGRSKSLKVKDDSVISSNPRRERDRILSSGLGGLPR